MFLFHFSAYPSALMKNSTLQRRPVHSVSDCHIRKMACKKNIRCKRSRRYRHCPEQSRSDTLPKSTESLRGKRLPDAVGHASELLLGTESITLHLALDDIERVAGEPESLAGKTTVGGDLDAGNIVTLDVVALGVQVHEILKRQEPDAVRLRFSVYGDYLSSVEAAQDALVSRQLPDAVEGSAVQPLSAVWLGLQADTHMLDGS
jgi:hypothetical protein